MKNKNYKYVWENCEENNLLRKYATDAVIKKINRESVEILEHKNIEDIPGTKMVNINKNDKVMIKAWSLIDLAYYMILWSNDYRGRKDISTIDIIKLQNTVDNYIYNKGKKIIKENMHLSFAGFVGEQIKFEDCETIHNNFVRELYILFDVNKSEKYNIPEIVYQETGVKWDKLICFLTLVWYEYLKYDTMEEIKKELKSIATEEFERIVNRYTADYCEIRESERKRQIFYTKPFIKTQKGEIISVSPYINLFLIEHCIFWVVRDFYNRKTENKNEFVIYFGDLFEKYFEELLSTCMEKEEYTRLPEQKGKKSADWEIRVGDYKILVEQKSSILMLDAKQQCTDISKIRKYRENVIIKAIKQLKETEESYGKGKFIKIILLYEDYFKFDILESCFESGRCSVENDNYYWILRIDEMEKLLLVYKRDKDTFYKIIKEKILRETNKSDRDKGITNILKEYNVEQNDYLNLEKFKKYYDMDCNTFINSIKSCEKSL